MFIKLGLGVLAVIFLFMVFRDETVQEVRDDKNKIVIEQLENKRLILQERYAKSGADYLKIEIENIGKKLEKFNKKDKLQEQRLAEAIANSEKAKQDVERELRGGN